MDIVFLVITVAAAALLPRSRALIVAVVAWAVCVAFVAWGPAHNSDVHVGSAGFWIPWSIALAIGVGVVYGVTALRARRQASRRAGQPQAS